MIIGTHFRRTGSTSHIKINNDYYSTTLKTTKPYFNCTPTHSKSELKDKQDISNANSIQESLNKGEHLRSSSMHIPSIKAMEKYSTQNNKKTNYSKFYKANSTRSHNQSAATFAEAYSNKYTILKDSSLSTKELTDNNINLSSTNKLHLNGIIVDNSSQRNLPLLTAQKSYNVNSCSPVTVREKARRLIIKNKSNEFEPVLIERNKYYAHNFVLSVEKAKSRPHSIVLSKVVGQLEFPVTPKRPKAALSIKKVEMNRASSYKISLKRIKDLKLVPNKFQDPQIRLRLDRLDASIKKLKNIKAAKKPLNLIIIK